MRRARVLLLALCLVVGLYMLIPYDWFGHRPRGTKFYYELERPAIFGQSCQFLEVPVEGREGAYRNSRFTLRGTIFLYRHGERSPIRKVNSDFEPDCIAYLEVDRRSFASYVKLLKSKDFQQFIDLPRATSYDWHPHAYKCRMGQLTAEGALQLVKLGTHLHESYASTGLFEDINNADIEFYASPYPRTFQSAIAFASAFFYVIKNLPRLPLRFSNNTYFCLGPECHCPNYMKVRKSAEQEIREEFSSITSPALYERIQLLGAMVGLEKVEHPMQFLDVILGRYVCRRNTLPCSDKGECFTVDDYSQVADEMSALAKRVFKRTSRKTRTMLLIEAWTLLNNIGNAIAQARYNSQGVKILRVYSGHDITLEPLLLMLALDHPIPPHYASRMVFELHETRQPIDGETIFVRVLFNGVDHTGTIDFCQPLVEGLCRGDALEKFAKRGILDAHGLTSLNAVCT